jgi:hypothetical protein
MHPAFAAGAIPRAHRLTAMQRDGIRIIFEKFMRHPAKSY